MKNLLSEVSPSVNMAYRGAVSTNQRGIENTVALNIMPEWDGVCLEMFGQLYKQTGMKELPVDQQSRFARSVMSQCAERGDWVRLKSACQHSRPLTSMSVASIGAEIGKTIGAVQTKTPEELQNAVKGLKDLLWQLPKDSSSIEKIEKEIKKCEGRLEMSKGERDSASSRVYVDRAIENAANAAEKAKRQIELLRGYGLGTEDSQNQDEIDFAMLQLFDKIPQLEDLIKMMGGMKIASDADFRKVKSRGATEIVGIEPGADPLRLVPSERVRLRRGGGLKRDLLRRLQDRSAQTWKMTGEDDERCNEGDFVIIMDRSGSMSGARIDLARAMCGAIMLKASEQGRRVVLVTFAGKATVSTLGKNKAGLSDCLKNLFTSLGSYTNAEVAIRAALKATEQLEKADILMVTDGDFQLESSFVDEAKKNEARLHGVIIGREAKFRLDGGGEIKELFTSLRSMVELTEEGCTEALSGIFEDE